MQDQPFVANRTFFCKKFEVKVQSPESSSRESVRFWNTVLGVRRGFISRIGLKLRASWPMAFMMCYMFAPGSVASATKQAGDSVKQLVMRTALADSVNISSSF